LGNLFASLAFLQELMVILFKNCHSIKMWKVFSNGKQTSPTSTLCKHFQHEHAQVWESKSHCLGVPKKSEIGQVMGSSVEQFMQEGLMVQLQVCWAWLLY